jgi:hypothetical protein
VAKQLFFSDDFIQAQQQLARWASEDVVSVVVMESDSSGVDPSAVAMAQNIIHPHITSVHQQSQPLPSIMAQPSSAAALHMAVVNMNGLGAIASRIPEFYHPSPPSTTETESSGSVMLTTQRRGIDVNGHGPQATESTGRYPEYKH